MDDGQLLRYSRHLLLPSWGIDAQQRLARAHALVIGVGGLGSPASLYLAGSGIGRLTLCDDDRVDLTNLQRQIALTTQDLGRLKGEATRERLAALNPEVEVVVVPERLAGAALEARVRAADVVLDCSDNFATRHAVNRACVDWKKPLVSGAAVRFEGQLAVFDRRTSGVPCYACLYPEHLGHDEEAERCAVTGVFGPLTGVVGALQAAEALKLVTGVGRVLEGLWLIDGESALWRRVRVPRDPACPVCQGSAVPQ